MDKSTAHPLYETKYNIVVAFDIGTTFSGYAYSKTNAPTEITTNTPWGNEFGIETYKTPSAVLVDDNETFVAFGYDAKKLYSGKNCINHLYDQYFKMHLYKARGKNANMKICSRDGKQHIPLLKVTTMAIKYLYNHFLDGITKAHDGIDVSAIRVVVTVPAIWPDSAKDFMRRSACNAGILSDNLILALEPETASLYCRTLKPTELQSKRETSDVLNLPNRTRYVVVDCGGGTVDISVHEVIDAESVKEIHTANGGPWGGSEVNLDFDKMLATLLGEDFIENYKEKCPVQWFKLDRDFEVIKRAFKIGQKASITLPPNFIKTFEKDERHDSFEDFINKNPNEGFEFEEDEGSLHLSAEVFKSLFQKTVQNIIEHMTELWNNTELRRVRYVFMVGGFSECEYLFNEVSDLIAGMNANVPVLRPAVASIAVLKGAVQFGHQPNAIKSRLSRLTYGVGVMKSFDPKIHHFRQRTIVDGVEKCNNIFEVWARKNERINFGEKKTFEIFPTSKSSTRFNVSIYAIDSETVMYTTDPGVMKLATLDIPVPDCQLQMEQRAVKHEVFFGGTELYVKIQDSARLDGASDKTKIAFAN